MADRDPPGAIGRVLVRLGDAASWLFFAAFVIGTWEVAMRYLFNAPTTWAHVLSTALCVVGFAAGGAYSMARDEHLRVTVLSDRARGAVRTALRALALACGAVYLAGLSWGLWREVAMSMLRFEPHWSPELTPGPPNWPLPAFAKTLLLVGALLFLLAVVDAAIRLVARRDPR